MKKIICILVVFSLCFSMTACVQTYSDVQDYHMIYDNVDNANKTFTKAGQKKTLLGWGEYMYCSYMLLFPREAPENLLDFEYYWSQGIDYDDYGIYFSYRLDDEEYINFKNKMKDFSITYKEQSNKPVYLENTFEYPAYIMSWSNDVDGSGFCEYILLDETTHTVISVYKMFYTLQELQSKANFNISPNVSDDNVFSMMPQTKASFAKHSGYSVYAFTDEENNTFIPELAELVYDNSFLDNI